MTVKGNNLIDTELLKQGWTKVKLKKWQSKTKTLYMVHFNIIWKKININANETKLVPDCLVYSYYEYNPNFAKFIVNYMENICELDIRRFNLNATVFVMQEHLKKLSFWNEETESEFIKNMSKTIGVKNTKIFNLMHYLLFTSCRGSLALSIEDISNLLMNLYEKKTYNIMDIFNKFNYPGEHTDVKGDYKTYIRENSSDNIIFNFVFLVQDLDFLLNNIKKLGINVNAGPQSSRGRCSFSDYKLSILDYAIRRSMYLYCNLNNENSLDESPFDFRNIHMNLGKVNW